MKIAFVTSTIRNAGGVETFTKYLSSILKEEGNDLTLITLEDLGHRPENYEEVLGVRFNQLNKMCPQDVVLSNGECGAFIDHPRAVNIIHGSYLTYALSVKDLVPLEVTQRRIEKAEMQRAAAERAYVVTVSNFAREGLERSGICVDRVINNSVDTNIFYPEVFKGVREEALAISRGRYYEKGFDILRRLAEKGIKLRLFSDEVIDLPNVSNNGLIEHENLRKEYNRALVFLHPSRFEGGSLTGLEAMACGCPIITTPVGYGPDIKKVIPNFVADSFAGIFAKYNLVINDRKRYSKEAREYFLEFHNPDKFRNEWISLIEEIASKTT